MPISAYIICAQSVSFDEETKQASYFQAIESIQIEVIPVASVPQGAIPAIETLRMVGVACWLREENEEGQEFEFLLRMRNPTLDRIAPIAAGTFKFEKPFHRFPVAIRLTGAKLEGNGIMYFECGIRKDANEDWHFQSYPIPYSVIQRDAE
jgi:hypothetical protein